ncbi:MAG: hypothetical protein IPK58_09495 [Acidobacteria bacterium]|nr:hypothetical protein [Acidobacteriota bacterium]
MDYQSGAVSPVGSIEKGWGIIKDDYWIFLGMTLVAGIITFIIAVILGLLNNVITLAIATVLGAAGGRGSDGAAIAMSIVPQIISMVISLFTNVIVLTVSGVLVCGIYSALAKKVNTGVADFGELFSGMSKAVPCLIFAIVLALFQFIIGLVTLGAGAALGVGAMGAAGMFKGGEINPAALGGILFAMLGILFFVVIVNFVISLLTTFVYPLIAERSMSGIDAMLLSMRAGLSNIGGLFLLMLLLALMVIGGALACLIGVVFVAPIISASIFAAYQSVFGSFGNNFQQTPPPPPVWGAPSGQQPGY